MLHGPVQIPHGPVQIPQGQHKNVGGAVRGGRTAPPLEWKKMSNGLVRLPYGARRGDRLNVTQTRRGSGMGKPIRLIDTKIF